MGNTRIMTANGLNFQPQLVGKLIELARSPNGGKRVAQDRYLHLEHPSAKRILESLGSNLVYPKDANVVRIGARASVPTISLSHYAAFFDAPFPELQWSYHLNPVSGGSTLRKEGANPAVLHRKELLLWPEHPRIREYEALTEELTKNRLLPTRSFIGRKHHWTRYLAEKGFSISDGRLVRQRHQ